MNAALWFLLSRSFVNGVLSRLKRLRQPKYLVGALIGGAYFYFYFYEFLLLRGLPQRSHDELGFDAGLTPDLYLDLAAVCFLAVLLVFAWLWPSSRAALAFTEAEVSLLFPAPLTRRQLLLFKLLKSQLGLLFFAVIMSLLSGRLLQDGHGWQHTIGWWVTLATLQLHRLGASFALTRLMDRGLSAWWRRLGILVLLGGVAGLLILWRQSGPEPPDLQALLREGGLGPYLRELVQAGPGPWLLAPFRLVVAPWFAPNTEVFLAALWPALIVLGAHFLWVIRSEVAFEEASLALSAKYAALIEARRSGKVHSLRPRRKSVPVFALRPTGGAVAALVWKSWLASGGRRSLRIGLIGAGVIIAISAIPWLTDQWKGLTHVSVLLGASLFMAMFFAGAQMTARAMRQELEMFEVLKTAPVPAWQVAFGQMLGPALRWAGLQWVAALVLFLGLLGQLRHPGNAASFLPVIVIGLALLLPPLNLLSGFVPSAAMIVFPGWFKPGEGRGIEGTGIGLLLLLAQVLFLAIALVIPGLAAAVIGYGLKIGVSVNAGWLGGAVAASAVMTLEAWLGALLLGRAFERFDVSAES